MMIMMPVRPHNDAVQCSDCRLFFPLLDLELDVKTGRERCPQCVHKYYNTLPIRASGIFHLIVDSLSSGRSNRI